MNELPQRKNIRLKYYNYAEEGYYFITICTKNKMNLLGRIVLNDRCVKYPGRSRPTPTYI